MASYTPGMEISGGSLGHGLGIAVGYCLALKRKQSKSFVYVMIALLVGLIIVAAVPWISIGFL